jgi:hypothetical protein
MPEPTPPDPSTDREHDRREQTPWDHPTWETAIQEPILHRAARIEDAVQEFREQRARRRGQVPTVIPYTGYGAPGWVRVLCRVLLTRRGLA